MSRPRHRRRAGGTPAPPPRVTTSPRSRTADCLGRRRCRGCRSARHGGPVGASSDAGNDALASASAAVSNSQPPQQGIDASSGHPATSANTARAHRRVCAHGAAARRAVEGVEDLHGWNLRRGFVQNGQTPIDRLTTVGSWDQTLPITRHSANGSSARAGAGLAPPPARVARPYGTCHDGMGSSAARRQRAGSGWCPPRCPGAESVLARTPPAASRRRPHGCELASAPVLDLVAAASADDDEASAVPSLRRSRIALIGLALRGAYFLSSSSTTNWSGRDWPRLFSRTPCAAPRRRRTLGPVVRLCSRHRHLLGNRPVAAQGWRRRNRDELADVRHGPLEPAMNALTVPAPMARRPIAPRRTRPPTCADGSKHAPEVPPARRRSRLRRPARHRLRKAGGHVAHESGVLLRSSSSAAPGRQHSRAEVLERPKNE